MRIQILIRTPKGQAAKTEKKIRSFILGMRKTMITDTNDDDNEIVWVLDCTPRDMQKVVKNVNMFHTIMSMAINNRVIRSIIKSKIDKNQQKELDEMLLNQTSVEIIKQARAKELANDSKSVFAKIKDLFK